MKIRNVLLPVAHLVDEFIRAAEQFSALRQVQLADLRKLYVTRIAME
jgi:hypothetical protein